MYDQIREDPLFIIFYTVVTTMAMMAGCYLLLRRGNAFAPDVAPPLRVRRWATVFFAAFTLSHVWYMPIFFLSSVEDIAMTDLVGGLLDSMTVLPLSIIVLLTMLQDRRRPLWPVAVMIAPIVVAGIFCVATHSYAAMPFVYAYFLLMSIGLIVYMVRALRQYGLWLRDNYADLENKEVWQSFVVLAIILLVFAIYAFIYEGPAYQYVMQAVKVVLICYLLWRVETLGSLESLSPGPSPSREGSDALTTDALSANAPLSTWRGVGAELAHLPKISHINFTWMRMPMMTPANSRTIMRQKTMEATKTRQTVLT